MDLVAAQCGALGGQRSATGRTGHLFGVFALDKGRLDVEESEPAGLVSRRLDAGGVEDAAAEHLVAAADADQRHAGAGAVTQRRLETALAQPGQIGHRGLGAGQHDSGRAAQSVRADDVVDGHVGLAGQRLEIGGVARERQAHHGDPQGRGGRRLGALVERYGVLFVATPPLEPGHDTQRGDVGTLLEQRETRRRAARHRRGTC